MKAARQILLARAQDDPSAEADAIAAAYTLWCRHKLAPPNLPPPDAQPIVHPNGLTILSPFRAPSYCATEEVLTGV